MKKTAILYVIDSLLREGTEKHLLEVVGRLPAEKYDFSLYAFSDGPLKSKFREHGVKVTVFTGRSHGLFGVRKFFALLDFMAGRRFDIVHTYLVSSDIWGRLAAIVKKVPVIISSKRGFEKKGARYILVSRFLNHFTEKIVFVSRDLSEKYRLAEKIPESKMLIIRNGVDLEKIEQHTDRSGAARKTHPGKTIGMVARLDPVKDYPTFIRAAGILTGRFAGLKFLIIGAGPEKQKLLDLTAELGLSDFVEFTGNVENVFEFIETSDYMVLASLYEGSPNAVLESMALGKPVVATAVGGTREIITDGIDGCLVPPQSPQLLADKLEELIRNPDLAENMGAQAREKIAAEFTLQKTVRDYHALYSQLNIRKTFTLRSFFKKIAYLAILCPVPAFPRKNRLPVLTYHSLDYGTSPLSVSPAAFENQMRFLNKKGFRSIGCAELLSYLDRKEEIPEKRFILTFDEGYADFKSALPVLDKYGFKAILFVVAGRTGEPAGWTSLDTLPTLTLSEIRSLPPARVEIGSHSFSHRELPGLKKEELQKEIHGARKLLESETNAPVNAFAYPFGKENEETRRLAAGDYRVAFGTRFGLVSPSSNRFNLERVDINILRDTLAFRAFFANYTGFCFMKRCWSTL